MRRRIVITGSQHAMLLDHFSRRDREQLAFLFAGVSQSRRHLDLLIRQVRVIRPSELAGRGRRGLELSDRTRREIFSAAAVAGHTVIEAHSHLGAGAKVTFSTSDNEGEAAFVPYVRGKLPGMPYAATVWSDKGVDARVWMPGHARPLAVDAIRVIGTHMLTLVPTSFPSQGPQAEDLHRYDRQIRAFGSEGQARLNATRVGIAGLGGTGSHVAQQLAYVGVRDFLLVDDDKIEASNLNRLIGAYPGDRGVAKVQVARRMILAIAPDAQVAIIGDSLMSVKALQALREVDLVVGCTDTDGSRLVLNEFAKAYLLPYVDCGSGIDVEQGSIVRLGGRVTVALPDGPCLLCAREIDTRLAQEELETPQERELRRQHGYVAGAEVPEPSVVSLNGVVASLAVGEIIALVTGWRFVTLHQTYYGEGRACSLPARRITQSPDCFVCHSQLGRGDAANMQRYARKGLAADLPA